MQSDLAQLLQFFLPTSRICCSKKSKTVPQGTDHISISSEVLTDPGAPDLGLTWPNESIRNSGQCLARSGTTCFGLLGDRSTSELTAGSSVGRLGPYTSASSNPVRSPIFERVAAKFAATVLFPTPPTQRQLQLQYLSAIALGPARRLRPFSYLYNWKRR